jgi:15-cis-phytoene synthase
MKKLFDELSMRCSKLTTNSYSTSFSLGILCLHRNLRNPIYSIYGFVRLADEIVDSFHGYNKEELLKKFKVDTYESIESGISIHPMLNSFQETVRQFGIEHSTIESFFTSMEMDLKKKQFSVAEYDRYIAGSAEAVGLMCLKVFSDGNEALYVKLKEAAMKLGSAFQKINFLRDLKADVTDLGRSYFPGLEISNFDERRKKEIESSILADFAEGVKGIRGLPRSCRLGVYVAYVYYLALFRKISNAPPGLILKNRVRIRNRQKATLLAYSFFKHQLNRI